MTPQRPKLSRALLKLSGEAFCTPNGFGIDPVELRHIASEIELAAQCDTQIAVVVGGGNIIRGATLSSEGLIHQANADYMGMLGTVINAIALREALEAIGRPARCMTAVHIPAVAEPFIRLRAVRHLEKGRIVILAGGTGNPYFTTDSAAALRAAELGCDAILKATKVDGVYSADPMKDPDATRFDTISFAEALERKLAIMDMTALAMCQDRRLPVVVFNFKESGNIKKVVSGEQLGTFIHNN